MRAHTFHGEVNEKTKGISIDAFLDLLSNVRKRGDQWMACCPAHEDRSPSLLVTEGEKGILVHCYAGCTYGEIVDSLGLRKTDLFFDSLNDSARAKYQYRRLDREIRWLLICCSIYQSDMEKGELSEEDKAKYRDHLANLNTKQEERRELLRKYSIV